MLRLVAACPESCVVCSRDVTLCHQLTYVVAVPVTTRVLIVTDGYFSSVESTNLSLLFNLALLSLGRNGIEGIQEDALYGLTKLQTLLLEHNRISSSFLPDHTFSKLYSLRVLVLSNNALHTLRGAWFHHTKALTRLQLDGNQITNLTDVSFRGSNLHSLRHLDLSKNLISFIEKDAFRPLPQLQEVDLSRNRLVHMPDVFSPLKHLSLLSLDRNQWSCSCDLHPLARFLRNYTKSSAHTLLNAKELYCVPATPAGALPKSVLRLSESNCEPKAPDTTLVVKDRRPLLPGQDVALMTVLGFAGAVGLTCLGLVVFNWKLQQGKANEHTSENLCCRTFDESPCAHGARNYHTLGYCNCHLTQENEIKVMSVVGCRKEMPLLQASSHQATLASESTALDGSFRNLKRKDHGADSTLLCLDGSLLESGCSEPPGKRAAFNDTGLVTRDCPRRVEKIRNLKPVEVQSLTLPHHIYCSADINTDTFRRIYATSVSALARESLERHLTNGSWQPPIEKEDNGLQPHRKRHFTTSSAFKPCEPKEYYVQRFLHKLRSNYDDPRRLAKWSKPTYFQPNNSLICKYVSCDQFQNCMKEKKPKYRECPKFEKEQIQINKAIEKFLTSEDNIRLPRSSTKMKKMHSTKKSSFHYPDLVAKNSLLSPEASAHQKQQENQSNQGPALDHTKCNNPGEKKEERKWLADSQFLNKRTRPSIKRIKLHLHPFRKVRVHPEKSLPELLKKHTRVLLPPNKLSKTVEEKAKRNSVSFVNFCQQTESNNCLIPSSKRQFLKHALKQAPYYKRNTKRALPVHADTLSVDKQSSIQSRRYPAGQVPNGNVATLPQHTLKNDEHRHSHASSSGEQEQGTTQLLLELPGYLPDTWENNILPSPHSREVIDQKAKESTKHIDQDKSKTNQLSQCLLSLTKQQSHLQGIHPPVFNNREYTLDQNQALLQCEEKTSSNKQLGNDGKISIANFKKSHQIMEQCCMGKEGYGIGESLPNTEIYDSSLISWTHSKNNSPTNSITLQNRTELPKPRSSSPVSRQAPWLLTNSSEKGIDSINALPRDDGNEALEIKLADKDALDESSSSQFMWTTQMTMKHPTKERQQTVENGPSETHVLYDSGSVDTIMVKDFGILTSHESQNTIPHDEIDIENNSNVHDSKEIQNVPSDKDSCAHTEGTMGMETQEALFLFSELKDSSVKAENEVSLVPGNIHTEENSAAVLHASAE
ncbi:leucine-rich repeat-containing protein 53 [Dipodomys spectabilis]|uniref:leucine-rich repeat-containing protein 53 n=1 Tax=Dipodomys spectabilis TaxID=105255 RepID=UPI001C546043|nr:leucine-rich repeat-containing protein 53 [Dipodomys spectabilis]